MIPTNWEFRRMMAALFRAAPCVVAAYGAVALAGTSFVGSFSGGGHAGSSGCSLDSSIGVIGGSDHRIR